MISCKNNYLRIHVCTIRKPNIRAISPLAVLHVGRPICVFLIISLMSDWLSSYSNPILDYQ